MATNSNCGNTAQDTRAIKRPMTLDLDAKSGGRPKRLRGGGGGNQQMSTSDVLTSPDLQAFALGSPEVENLIRNGIPSNHSQPTPMSVYLCPNAKNVTDKQAQFVKGFEDALLKFQQQDSTSTASSAPPAPSVNNTVTSAATGASVKVPLSSASVVTSTGSTNFTTLTNLTVQNLEQMNVHMGTTGASSQNNSTMSSDDINSDTSDSMTTMKDEQTVPYSSLDGMPIDMRDQEKLKLERKRLRNRIAASKCRKKKLQRISELQEQVDQLRSDNQEFEQTVMRLRSEVHLLEQQASLHRQQGCLLDL